ncbi:Hypothetical predicted protein, partial [Paramuricea clavata]
HHLNGVLKKGIRIESENTEIVAVEEFTFCKDDSNHQVFGSFQCPRIERTGNVVLTSPHHVIDK